MALTVKNPPANAGVVRDGALIPGLGGSPGRGQHTTAFMPEESHGERNVVSYILWGHKELDNVTQLSKYVQIFHLGKILIRSCIF